MSYRFILTNFFTLSMIRFTSILSVLLHSRNLYTSFCFGYSTFIFSSKIFFSPCPSIIFSALYTTSAHFFTPLDVGVHTCFHNDFMCYLQLMVVLLVHLKVLYEDLIHCSKYLFTSSYKVPDSNFVSDHMTLHLLSNYSCVYLVERIETLLISNLLQCLGLIF